MNRPPDEDQKNQMLFEGLYLGCFALFILGLWTLLIGIHNIDQGRNFLWLAVKNNINPDTFADCNAVSCSSIAGLHDAGMNALLTGTALITLSWLAAYSLKIEVRPWTRRRMTQKHQP